MSSFDPKTYVPSSDTMRRFHESTALTRLVAGPYRAVRGKFDAMMADLIEKFETKTGFDAPGRAHMDNVVREAFGEDTGDQAAKALAQAWDGTAETARHMFNAAGGAIGKLDGWGLPQMHDPVTVRRAGGQGCVGRSDHAPARPHEDDR